MAGSTDHYGLTTLGAGDQLSENDYAFTRADRERIDNLLFLGVEGHRHTGAATGVTEPDTAPTLEIDSLSGAIPSGTRVYYKYTYVDVAGTESAPSPEAFIDTPASVDAPTAPVVEYATTGGTLLGGAYYYALSAYTGTNISETRAPAPAYLTVPTTTATNTVTLTLPALPSGADGFNVYRRAPGNSTYHHLDSVDMTVATPPTEYVDDGSVTADCDRPLPAANTTNSQNNITITLPGATPAVPDGYTWKIYRTYVNGDYSNSLVTHRVETEEETYGDIIPYYTDQGASTQPGSPPAATVAIGAPEQIELTDAAEVQGVLPMANVTFPYAVHFQVAGPLSVLEGAGIWTCEFPYAEIVAVRAALGRDSTPSSQPVIVDVIKGTGTATPVYSSIFPSSDKPRVETGQQVGARYTPDDVVVEQGDVLTVDINQTGGGATPTDRDLVVTISLILHGYPTDSFTPTNEIVEPGSF